MTRLIVGGTSGLGLEIAKLYVENQPSEEVVVTGRRDLKTPGVKVETLDLSGGDLSKRIKEFVGGLPKVDTLVYAAGYFQEGTITDLSDDEIEEMISVGGRGLIYFVKHLLNKQGALDEVITITSTSHWTPRKLEPVYNYTKAGAGHFASGLSEDDRIGKSLVVGPAGMATNFWEGQGRDMGEMLDPAWVAKEIIKLNQGEFVYKFSKILRQPSRVEIVEVREERLGS